MSAKSVITCDLEGRIETFNEAAVAMFGWSAEEVVGRKRVSLFSPGEVVLQHVPVWLSSAVANGEHRATSVFLRKDGTPFAAQIRITPTYKDKKQIGYCGVTEPLPEVSLKDAAPHIAFSTRVFRWLVVTRAPFLTATLVPVLVGAAWAATTRAAPFPWLAFALALAGALALHVSANTFNDYFDWTSGTDQLNNDYFLPFSGGSRAIELGLVTPRGLFGIAVGALAVAAGCGAVLALQSPVVLAFGALGAFAAFFYTAPPLRLAARKGLGELFVGLCFGPLLTAGTAAALTGEATAASFLIGVVPGLLTTAILWINEFPDAASDLLAGKKNLVVVLGRKAARWGYAALLAGAALTVPALVLAGVVRWPALLTLGAAPLGIFATRTDFRHYEDRLLVSANQATIALQFVSGLLLAGGILWGPRLAALLG